MFHPCSSCRHELKDHSAYGTQWVHMPNEARVLFYKESVDRSVRAYLPGLRRIFAKHVHEEESRTNTVHVDEMGFRMNFRQFFNLLDEESHLLPSMLTPLAARQIFNEAKMEAIIGVASAKTDRLSFCDFIDALCRIAYYLAPFQPVENVLLLLFDDVFFSKTRDQDMDRRFFQAEQYHMLQNTSLRMTRRAHTFFAKKEEPLGAIFQCHLAYMKVKKRQELEKQAEERRKLPNGEGLMLYGGINRAKGF